MYVNYLLLVRSTVQCQGRCRDMHKLTDKGTDGNLNPNIPDTSTGAAKKRMITTTSNHNIHSRKIVIQPKKHQQ